MYQYLGDLAGLSRKEAKTQLLEKVLFTRNGYSNAVKRVFRREFPTVAEFMHRMKADDHARLAVALQKAESDFVIKTVCRRIMRERPGMFVGTVHDFGNGASGRRGLWSVNNGGRVRQAGPDGRRGSEVRGVRGPRGQARASSRPDRRTYLPATGGG